ncbi:hypothetical protein, partial [Secundilactobacillus kimchicus]|uniref:hypothetical protein n=1 Tax=Secundilactobacillus kimchicus TaxID=528209 RepID=UPI001C039D30
MPVEMNARKISKIYHGTGEVYSDNDDWKSLELGPKFAGKILYQIDVTKAKVTLVGTIQTLGIVNPGDVIFHHPASWKLNAPELEISVFYTNVQQSSAIENYFHASVNSTGDWILSGNAAMSLGYVLFVSSGTVATSINGNLNRFSNVGLLQ